MHGLRGGNVLLIWKLDRLGRNLAHLVGMGQDLSDRGVGLRVLAGQGVQIDTTAGRGSMYGIFAALTEFERELSRKCTVAGLRAARASGRKGDRKFALWMAQVRLAQAAISNPATSVADSAGSWGSGAGRSTGTWNPMGNCGSRENACWSHRLRRAGCWG